MLSNHLILCLPFSFCLPSFPPSGSFLMSQFFCIRWPKYWSFSNSSSKDLEQIKVDTHLKDCGKDCLEDSGRMREWVWKLELEKPESELQFNLFLALSILIVYKTEIKILTSSLCRNWIVFCIMLNTEKANIQESLSFVTDVTIIPSLIWVKTLVQGYSQCRLGVPFPSLFSQLKPGTMRTGQIWKV